MPTYSSVITGTGHHLPKRVIANSYFEDKLDTSDEWIITRTGIKQRYFADHEETTSTLGIEAAKKAISDSGVALSDIDLILVATSTPDLTFPSVATQIQAGLGIEKGCAFDIQAVCAGFVFAVANANALIKAGEATKALVIGTETFSRILDQKDRSTCILFGDGAGAIVLEKTEVVNDGKQAGILATDLNSNGRYRELLYVDGGVSSTQTTGYLRMQGREVFRHAVNKLVSSSERVMNKANLDTIDWAVPHQANFRIIQQTSQRLNLDKDKVILTLDKLGNTSAASIPISLSITNQEGKFKPGDIILSHAIGGGFCWGSFVFRWQ